MSSEQKTLNSGLRWLFRWENLSRAIVTVLGLVVAGTAYYYSTTATMHENTKRICALEENQKQFATKTEVQAVKDDNNDGFAELKDDIKEVKEQNKQILQYLLDQKIGGR